MVMSATIFDQYFRCLEDPLVFNNLGLERGLKLVDVGSSNTIFPLLGKGYFHENRGRVFDVGKA
jgi:hypothetical protein